VRHLRFDEEAETELFEAADFYSADNPAVARRFIGAVFAAIAIIHRAPHEWPLSPDVAEHLDVHRRRVDAFPYSVVYAFNETEVRVLAIAHSRREPGYWRKRVASAG
jgi:toxin ParE1/3/4